MSDLLQHHLMPLIREYGVLGIGVVTALESTGLPLPGESAVVAAALYAAETHAIGIVPLVAAAATGAIVGDNIGYLIGAQLGFPLLRRYGRHVGLSNAKIKLGRYLFQRHGAKVVFFGRFIAFLRTIAALLAGANHMDWKRFLFFNALGGVAWTALYGFGAYALGERVKRLEGPFAIGLGVVTAIVVATLIYLTKRNGARFQQEAEAAFADDEN